jgi:hypothetical protein
VPVSTGTQRTLATHRLPKSHAPRAPQWPHHLATGPSIALATALASSLLSTYRKHRVLYHLKQPSTASKRLIFYPSTLPPRRGFCSHRRAHMRACSLHRRTYMHACSLHRCIYAYTEQVCISAPCFLHRRTLTRACSPYIRAQVRACQTYRHALMRAYSTHRNALRVRLKFPLSITHAHIFDVQARTHMRLSPSHLRMGGPHPLNTPVRPPVQTLPKN